MSNDKLTSELGMLDITHHMIHEGRFFTVTDGATIGAAASRSQLILTDTNPWHFYADLSASAAGTIYLYEGITASDAGTALTAYCNYRSSANTCGITFGYDPTVSGTGTTLEQYSIGSSGGFFTFGGTTSNRYEWMLKPSTKYLLRVTSSSAGNVVRANIRVYLGGSV